MSKFLRAPLGQVHVGLFASAPMEIESAYDLPNAERKLKSEVRGIRFGTKSQLGPTASAQRFEVHMSVQERASRFQWRFAGKLQALDKGVALVGRFCLPRFVAIYVAVVLAGTVLLTIASVVAAISLNSPIMWLIPGAGCVVVAGTCAVLWIGRAMTIESMQRCVLEMAKSLSPLVGTQQGAFEKHGLK